ncbi:ABC transporter ATP-binding protein [Bradyrhizobium tropiciagri]|uniref:ABC transporter ATP-binding protein n=1 Tax=Bradyrhizobium tropiciagri TaxID=312253 RepID=UPI001FCCEB92|nr:ABC transporter ATP-binding protein [Bradyrhizobium tropiciagri]
MTATNSMPSGISMELLRAADLTKRYGEDAAIAGVTFEAAAGEVLGIVGPNGAGKTTLLETLAGLIAADSGGVFWLGVALPPSRRKAAMFYLPDGIRPYQDRFTIQVLKFFANVYRRSTAEIARAVAALELQPVLRKRVSALSKGYNRRLLLAIGLLAPQPVLLMDEPFDGFDLRQTRSIIEVLRKSAGDGRTFILAVHQLTDAERVCDRFLLLAGGQIRGIGSLRELRKQTGIPQGSLEEIFLALT